MQLLSYEAGDIGACGNVAAFFQRLYMQADCHFVHFDSAAYATQTLQFRQEERSRDLRFRQRGRPGAGLSSPELAMASTSVSVATRRQWRDSVTEKYAGLPDAAANLLVPVRGSPDRILDLMIR